MAEVVVLSRAELQQLLSLEVVIPIIEKALIAADGRTIVFPSSGSRSRPIAASSGSSPDTSKGAGTVFYVP